MKIALIENFGSDFYNARLRYALFLKNEGHDVIAIVPNDGYADKIESAGIRVISLDIDIRRRNLSTMFLFAKELRQIFRNQYFDVIHFYRMQPNLIGTPMAFMSSRRSKLVNHITGLGVAFTKNGIKYNLIKFIIKAGYRINNKIWGAKLIFQNAEDKSEIGKSKSFYIIKGSAVNEDKFYKNVASNNEIGIELFNKYQIKDGLNLIFVSRLLKQKGLQFLVDAVQKYNNSKSPIKVNVIVAGWIDENNPDSFSEDEINKLRGIERIAILGKRTDIDKLINFSDVAVLPTFYREGTPRFLLEAMSIGKPILTTDMPGCNHLVIKQENGILVKPKNVDNLVEAIEFFVNADRDHMGDKSREIYERCFSEDVVYNDLLNIYHCKK